MKTEVFEDKASFLAALQGKPRQKRGRATRPDLPAAGRAASTGLTSLIAGKGRVWSTEFRAGAGFRLYVLGQPACDTGFLPTEQAACDAAKALR